MLITQIALARMRTQGEQELACLMIGEALLQASSPSTTSTSTNKSSDSLSSSPSPSPGTAALPSPWPVALVSKCVSLTIQVLGRQGRSFDRQCISNKRQCFFVYPSSPHIFLIFNCFMQSIVFIAIVLRSLSLTINVFLKLGFSHILSMSLLVSLWSTR